MQRVTGIELTGVSWGATGVWTLVILMVVTFIKVWPLLSKIRTEADGSLRTDLLARVGVLEARLEGAYERIADLEKLLSKREQEHAAILEDVRHELANETQSLDAFIMLAEANPDKVLDQLPRIKEMRARHKERVALRRGASRAVIQEDGK